MENSIEDHIAAGGAAFKWVQHRPVGQLKKLDDKNLIELRAMLIKEVREVGRALQWVDGIIKLKKIEQEKLDNQNPLGHA